MVVLGIDPGTASTGFGVVAVERARTRAHDAGVIATPAQQPMEARLAEIHTQVAALLEIHSPDAVAVEDIYFGQNARSAFAVGHARGVVLLAAGCYGAPCFTYTPQAIKKGVCGSGSAGKDQVQRMVHSLLELERPLRSDHAADALAVAVCHLNHAPLDARVPA